jgi:hypothetical protein
MPVHSGPPRSQSIHRLRRSRRGTLLPPLLAPRRNLILADDLRRWIGAFPSLTQSSASHPANRSSHVSQRCLDLGAHLGRAIWRVLRDSVAALLDGCACSRPRDIEVVGEKPGLGQ